MLTRGIGSFLRGSNSLSCLLIFISWCWCVESIIEAGDTSEDASSTGSGIHLECHNLRIGQQLDEDLRIPLVRYICKDPEIDNDTQQPYGCDKETQTAEVPCLPVKGINCSGQVHDGETVGFMKTVPCKWTNGYKFSVAMLLSVFLGMFGVDRFYLGYPAIGLLKLCTLGFMFLGQLIDILLIALQVVGPSDGSNYVIDYYGPVLYPVKDSNETYILLQYDYEYGYNYEL